MMARRRSKSTRRRPRRNSNVLWYLAIFVCLALVFVVGFVAQKLTSSGRIDEATLCHNGGAINATAILLDLTDPLSTTQQARLKTILANEVAESPIDTMIAIGVVSEASENWGARFAKCKPLTGDEANGLYENPALIAERYAREFTDPIQGTLKSMLTTTIENQSPIMEALQSLVSETPDFTRAPGRRKIIIVSDMLQNSDNLSFYRGQGWEYFIRENGAKRLAENLSGVSVEILNIPRPGGKTPPADLIEGFWTRYFDKQGTRPPSVSSLGDL